LNELQRAKQGNQRFILSPEQEAEIEKFRHKEAEANRQLKEERKQLRHEHRFAGKVGKMAEQSPPSRHW